MTLFCSCESKKNDLLFDTTIRSLITSNKVIESNTGELYKSLKLKTNEIVTKEIAQEWLNKTQDLKFKTNSLVNYLDALIKDPKNEFEDLDKFLKEHLRYLNQILDSNRKINLIDSLINEVGYVGINKFLKKNQQKENIIKIELLKNSIILSENKVIEFANNSSMPGCVLNFDIFKTIIGQNALHFKKGDELKITAGVGAFSVTSSPTIIFNEKTTLKPTDGVSIYTKQITSSPGKYKVPIKIIYIDTDGEQKKVESEIEYEVH